MPRGVYERTPEIRASLSASKRGKHGHPWTEEQRERFLLTYSTAVRTPCPNNCGFEVHPSALARHRKLCDAFRCEVDACDERRPRSATLCATHHALNGTAKKYGETVHSVLGLLRRQDGRCAVCPTALSEGGLGKIKTAHIDHDHVTGRVRGLLCHPCNVAIGLMKDNPDTLRQAAKYLEK